ncbi:MAG TPA: hypothetical protein VGJ53_05670 [Micromonosporaceae bacterium]|jgi:predicted lipoprotein with Yx(FWY)xxD motif
MINHRTSGTTRRRRLTGAAVVGVAAVALALSACGNGSNGSNSGGSGGGGSPSSVPKANGQLLSAQPTSLGTILVNGKGMTVYQFAKDKDGTSTCTGACAANWPFVPAPASLPASLPGVTGKLGSTTRPDGAHQLTIAGHPVYTFAGDSAPGQTNGQGLTNYGGLWTALSPAGAAVSGTGSMGGGSQPPAGPTY